MWKVHSKLADVIASRFRSINHIAQTRKQEPDRVARRYGDVAIRADLWSGPFAREELFAVTFKASCVLGELRYIRKCIIALANFFPVGGRNLVTRITGKFLLRNVSAVRKVGVFDDAGFGAGFGPSLRCNRNNGHDATKNHKKHKDLKKD